MKMSVVAILALLGATVGLTAAGQVSHAATSGGCIAYGDNYAFMLDAPEGWVLSCDVSEHSDVPVALWPKGSTWADAVVVMYVNPSPKSDAKQSLKDFVSFSDTQFRKDKPGLKITPGDPLETADHSHAIVQKFTGDPWGNVEAVAYIESKTIFAIITLSARSEAKYKDSYAAFEKLVSTYSFMNKVDGK